MPRPLYSKLLAEYYQANTGPVNYPLPPGVIWVVRDMTAYCSSGSDLPANPVDVYDNGNNVLWHIGSYWNVPGASHHWDGRQVIDEPHGLYIATVFGGWSVRVSGYELTTP